MNPTDQLVAEIEAFLSRTGMSASRFGRLSCNDASFFDDLKGGREPRFSTVERVRQFMAEWPSGGPLVECAGPSAAGAVTA